MKSSKIGIFCPAWLLAWHNTDHDMVKMFSRLDEFAALQTDFVASRSYTLSFNFNKVLKRVISGAPLVLHHQLKEGKQDSDLIYHYGTPAAPESFFKAVSPTPVFLTTGFMTDRYMESAFGRVGDRQKEADQLARMLEKAAMIHFHTEGGRERFLHYRPDFENKAVAVPFFLPNLKAAALSPKTDDQSVKILFVGNEGARKGLFELIAALDLLGITYLKNFKVEVTVVSRDRPMPTCGIKINWFKKVAHAEVLRLMEAADIFVLVPKNESYGLVLIEAMNASCAVLTDDDDTRKEILADTGVMLSSGTPKAIASGLKMLIEDPEGRAVLSNLARARVADKYMPAVVAGEYAEHFDLLSKSF